MEGLYNTFVQRMKSFHFKERRSLFKGLVTLTDCDETHVFFVLPGMKPQDAVKPGDARGSAVFSYIA